MKLTYGLLLLLFLSLFSCKGSDSYQGAWKGLDSKGNQVDFYFEPTTLRVDQNGKSETFEYKQNSISIENGKKSFGIRLKTGKELIIAFPIAKQPDRGLILSGEEIPIYTINRTDYMTYEELYSLTD